MLLSKTYFPDVPYYQIRYYDDNGVSRYVTITRITKIYDLFAYELQEALVNKSDVAAYVWFVKKMVEQPIIPSILDHRIFDFNNHISEHADVLDFDLDLYHQYLLGIVNTPGYTGRLDPNTSSPTEIEAYKQQIRDILDSYFNTKILTS